jgi:hypothetical protein
VSKKTPKPSKDDRTKGKAKRAPRAPRVKAGGRRVDERFVRFDLRLFPKDSPEYWQEVLRREGLRLGRGKPSGQKVSYGWKF